MRSRSIEGIIIKRRNFGEADRILTVHTREMGKISIKALGVRRIVSRRSAHIELLNISMMQIYQGRGMPILTEVSVVESFPEIKSDLKLIGYAYHACELIESLCAENQENNQAYFLLREFLSGLSQEENIVEGVYNFEISLLKILGYWRQGEVLPRAQVVPLVESILERRLKSRQIISRFV